MDCTAFHPDVLAYLTSVYDAALGNGHTDRMRRALATPPQDTTARCTWRQPRELSIDQLRERLQALCTDRGRSVSVVEPHPLLDDVIVIRGEGALFLPILLKIFD